MYLKNINQKVNQKKNNIFFRQDFFKNNILIQLKYWIISFLNKYIFYK